MELLERLLSKTTIVEDGCWIWRAAVNAYGYGVLRVNRKTERSHRLMYECLVGPIPQGMLLRHTCDNRWCVNPDHLLVGTQAQNVKDMQKRERGHSIIDRKTASRILFAIKKSGLTSREIGEQFGVSKPTVQDIKAGRTWTESSLFEGIIEEIHRLNWRVNNLFQLDDGWWQANLRSPTLACDFGRGPSPAEALEAAFDRVHAGCVGPLAEQSTDAGVAPTVDLRELMKLNQPLFVRRF